MGLNAQTSRIGSLDGLRGLAALLVYAANVVGLFYSERHSYGQASVDLFFVLSGFVLALPFVGERARRLEYLNFTIRRLFRIYPVYWLALAVAMLLRAQYQPVDLDGFTAWGRHAWTAPVSALELLRHAILIGPSFELAHIDPVIWSLVVEMRMSLLFPIAILVLRRMKSYRATPWILAAAILIPLLAARVGIPTLTFLPLFVLGGLLARFEAPLVAWMRRRSSASAAAIALAALALFNARSIAFDWLGLEGDVFVADLVVAFASAALIVVALGRARVGRVLERGLFEFFGKISYPFYLLHFPVLLAVAAVVYPFTGSQTIAWSAALAVALALSYLAHRLVEAPAQSLGRIVAARVSGAIAARHSRGGPLAAPVPVRSPTY